MDNLFCGKTLPPLPSGGGLAARLSSAARSPVRALDRHSDNARSLIGFSPESRSPSARNPDHFHPGIVITLPRNPQVVGYWLVVWALSIGALAPVAALREVGVIIAAVLASVVLKERFGPRRIAAAVLVAAGAILLRWS
jgi:hypothetical protein